MLKFFGDGLGLPSVVIMDANLSTKLPRFAWATNRLGVESSGSGLGLDGLRRALGEYFERRHFYHEVRRDALGTLSDVCDDEVREHLLRCLQQTARPDHRSALETHRFSLSSVITLPDYVELVAPSILFSITGAGLDADRHFAPARDTTGCAVHFRLSEAVAGALRELVERQYLLRYWLTGGGGSILTELLKPQLSRGGAELVSKLDRSGSLELIEISRGEIAGAVVLAIYRGTNDARVRYCVGLSCSASPFDAADRAVKELWQSYLFLQNMRSNAEVEALVRDRYHTYFLSCNRLEVADQMCAGASRSDSLTPAPAGDEDLLTSIYKRMGRVLLYARSVRVATRMLWCVRVVCPGGFLHIDNANSFNLECAFSDRFSEQILSDRKSVMVPFP